MTSFIDDTHDASRKSWVELANGHAVFPLQNLPFGVFSTDSGQTLRGGVAIGDEIFDMGVAWDAGCSNTAVLPSPPWPPHVRRLTRSWD